MSKPDRIKVSMEFNVMGNGIWLTAESAVAPDEDVIEEFKKGRDILIQSFKTMNEGQYRFVEPATYFTPSMQPEPITPDAKTDKEFTELKKKLSKFKTGQAALDYLSTTPFRHTIEAKQYIQNKFSNNGKVNTKNE